MERLCVSRGELNVGEIKKKIVRTVGGDVGYYG